MSIAAIDLKIQARYFMPVAAVGHKVACGQPGYAGGFKYLSHQTKIFTNNMLNFSEIFTTILITMVSINNKDIGKRREMKTQCQN